MKKNIVIILTLAVAATLCLAVGCKKAVAVKCTDSVKSLAMTDESFKVQCPGDCTFGSVWGTDLYTTDSSICLAAIHAGIITKDGGTVKVELKPGQQSYTGSEKNGVRTSNWGSYDRSFSVSK